MPILLFVDVSGIIENLKFKLCRYYYQFNFNYSLTLQYNVIVFTSVDMYICGVPELLKIRISLFNSNQK